HPPRHIFYWFARAPAKCRTHRLCLVSSPWERQVHPVLSANPLSASTMKWCLMTKKPPPPDLRLAGKERGLNGRVYPVLLHGIDAVAFCFALWRHHVAPGLRTTIAGALGVDEDTAVRVLAYWTGLHDVCKIDAFFQANRLGLTIPDGYLQAEGSSHGHATLGCQWLSMVLPETGYPPLDDEDPSPDWSLNSSVATT